jgi:hypothetical protein
MKTAMQELIEWVKVNDLSLKVSLYNNELINKLNKALEKEKEQIIKAHENGQAEFDSLHYRDKNVRLSNNYYNQTYNQKQLIIDIMKADEDDGLYKMSEEEIRDWHMIQSLKEKYGE